MNANIEELGFAQITCYHLNYWPEEPKNYLACLKHFALKSEHNFEY